MGRQLLALLTVLLALTFPAGASAEPAINLGAEVQPSSYQGYAITDAAKAPCEGCYALSGAIEGPATAIAFRAASSPYSLAYDWLLNDPCQRNPQTWDIKAGPPEHEHVIARVPCPTSAYSGPFTVYLASWWFEPATWTFYVWAEHPVASCHPHASTELDEGISVPRPAEPQDCPQERCSQSQIVTLPATVTVSCTTNATAVRYRRHDRRLADQNGRSDQRRLSMPQAQRAIAHWIGPGTTITSCDRGDALTVGCDYSTPSCNIGIEAEEADGSYGCAGMRWSSYATARLTRRGVHVEADGLR